MKQLKSVAVIRFFLCLLLFLRIIVFFLSKPVLKEGDIVKLKGRVTKISPETEFQAKTSFKTVNLTLNDEYQLVVPFNFLQKEFFDLKNKKMLVWGIVKCQEVKIAENCKQIIYAEKVQVLPIDFYSQVFGFFDQKREKLKNLYLNRFPLEEGQILSGIVLGETSGVSKDLLEKFQKTGTIHLFAASGMNLTIFAGFLVLFFGLFVGRKTALVFSCLASFLYVCLIGFVPSILRAFFMFVFANLSEILGRQKKVILSLIFSAGFLVFLNPQIIFNLGFQLSVLSTFAIVSVSYEKIENQAKNAKEKQGDVQKILQGFWKAMKGDFLVSTRCFLFSAPLIVFCFGRINFLSVLPNILVLWSVDLIMISGVFIAVFEFLFSDVFHFGDYLVTFFARLVFPLLLYFKKVIEEFSKLDFGVINVDRGDRIMFFIIFSLVFWCIFLFWKIIIPEQWRKRLN